MHNDVPSTKRAKRGSYFAGGKKEEQFTNLISVLVSLQNYSSLFVDCSLP